MMMGAEEGEQEVQMVGTHDRQHHGSSRSEGNEDSRVLLGCLWRNGKTQR